MQPDADGVLRTGIYQRRVVPRKKTEAERDADFEALWQSLGGPTQTIREWLKKTTDGIIESVMPHLAFDDNCQSGLTYFALPVPGKKWVRVADNVSVEWQEYVNDANEAVCQIRVLEHHIAADDSLTGDLQWVVQNAYRLGRTIERMQIRPFEPIVKTELSRRKKRGARKKTETRLTDPQWKLVEEFIRRRRAAGDSAAKACDKASAQLLTGTFPRLKDQEIEISSKRLQNLWSERNK